ncbi:MAG: peptidoglycan-binding domain-containing protein [Acidobacteriota bacterium]
MKRPRLLLLPLLALALVLTPAVSSAPPKAQAKKPAVQQGAKSAAKKRTAGKGSRSRRRVPATAQAPRQQQPEPQRIREIQQALAERGYAVEPTGVWDAATVEALRKFQEDHDINNLSGRGKLDPLTLIALGLGPAHTRPALSGGGAPQNSTEGKQP